MIVCCISGRSIRNNLSLPKVILSFPPVTDASLPLDAVPAKEIITEYSNLYCSLLEYFQEIATGVFNRT